MRVCLSSSVQNGNLAFGKIIKTGSTFNRYKEFGDAFLYTRQGAFGPRSTGIGFRESPEAEKGMPSMADVEDVGFEEALKKMRWAKPKSPRKKSGSSVLIRL